MKNSEFSDLKVANRITVRKIENTVRLFTN